jgi:hypothetical protein
MELLCELLGSETVECKVLTIVKTMVKAMQGHGLDRRVNGAVSYTEFRPWVAFQACLEFPSLPTPSLDLN